MRSSRSKLMRADAMSVGEVGGAGVLEPERGAAAPSIPSLLVPTLSQDQGWAAVARRRLHLPDLRLLAVAITTAALVAILLGLGFGFSYGDLAAMPLPRKEGTSAASPRSLARAEQKLAAGAPRGVRIEVDTIANRLYLKQGNKTLREAVCSTGTGGLLVDPGSGRRWVFETPHGVHRVLDKKKDPVWNKPDWAFVEEGTPIPATEAERLDPYSLGDYALYLGGGYLIHGTLYQRLLGRSVTHGCIRLGDEDLAAVFKATPVGARVYIY
ncbi:MAG TPA: L,D-transpeptidase [Thermoanaerobaculia bacterium]|jgi:L,D-transpeptidase YbiS|nr:L,D-transpeptidase [Thermoanaerobaculia bacterium]